MHVAATCSSHVVRRYLRVQQRQYNFKCRTCENWNTVEISCAIGACTVILAANHYYGYRLQYLILHLILHTYSSSHRRLAVLQVLYAPQDPRRLERARLRGYNASDQKDPILRLESTELRTDEPHSRQGIQEQGLVLNAELLMSNEQ